MWFRLRKTAKRGLSAVPRTFFRIRLCTPRRISALLFSAIILVDSAWWIMKENLSPAYSQLFTGLARLQPVKLISVADPFSFVSVGLAKPVQFGGYLAELLLIDPGQRKR